MENVVALHTDPNKLKNYKSDMEKCKRLILYGVKDHIVSHLVGKNTSKEMWEDLSLLYEGISE